MNTEMFRFNLEGLGMNRPEYGNLRYRAALEEQERLRGLLRGAPLPGHLRLVAGADCSFNRFGSTFSGGLVVCDADDAFRVVNSAVVRMEVDFPYLPGLLGFREVPVLAAAFAKLKTKPEVTLVDAHGIAHPRRFGSAAHLGVVLGVPTVGCAKSLLCGTFKEPGDSPGSWSPLMDDGERIGAALRTRVGVAPVFVSPGHLSDLPSSLDIVLRCARRYRIPQPIRLAHELVNRARRGEMVIR
jgi:deoxyribonuclease V